MQRIYDTSKYIEEFEDKLHKYWRYLCRVYDVNSPLEISNITETVNFTLQSIPLKNDINIEKIKQMILESSYEDTIASSMVQYRFDYDTKDRWTISHLVLISRERLYMYMLENINHLDKLYKLYKVSLRHEMGHILRQHELVKQHGGLREFYEALHNESSITRDAMQHIIDLPWKEMTEKYHNLPGEKIANELVGLTWKDHYRVNKYLEKSSKFIITEME